MGQYNSSLTRVRPFFQALLDRDITGATWLSQLLLLGPHKGIVHSELIYAPGELVRWDLHPERKLYPSREFLRWLILNPGKLSWPEKGRRQFGGATQRLREQLIENSEDVIRSALSELEREGVSKSERKWWAFEGCTFVDCYLETEKLNIYVEGKRKDVLSSATDWYPSRNQLVRNLESASADAKGKPFFCLLMVERHLPDLTQDQIDKGLPHLAAADRAALMQHFVGAVTWRDACKATGVPYESLPDAVGLPR